MLEEHAVGEWKITEHCLQKASVKSQQTPRMSAIRKKLLSGGGSLRDSAVNCPQDRDNVAENAICNTAIVNRVLDSSGSQKHCPFLTITHVSSDTCEASNTSAGEQIDVTKVVEKSRSNILQKENDEASLPQFTERPDEKTIHLHAGHSNQQEPSDRQLSLWNLMSKSGQKGSRSDFKSPTYTHIKNFLSGSSSRHNEGDAAAVSQDDDRSPWNVGASSHDNKSKLSNPSSGGSEESAEVLAQGPSKMVSNKSIGPSHALDKSPRSRRMFRWREKPHAFSRDSALGTVDTSVRLSNDEDTSYNPSDSESLSCSSSNHSKTPRSSVSMYKDPFIEFQVGKTPKSRRRLLGVFGCLQANDC